MAPFPRRGARTCSGGGGCLGSARDVPPFSLSSRTCLSTRSSASRNLAPGGSPLRGARVAAPGRERRVLMSILAKRASIFANDAVGERDARLGAHEFAHLEARGAFTADIKAATITLGRREHLIVAALDHLGEVGIESHDRTSALELRRAGILEPNLRALHAIDRPVG